MKVLVTGGAGFIGTNLIHRLLKKKYEVFCIDNFYSSNKKNLDEFMKNERFNFYELNIIKELKEEIKQIDFDQIYHLACPASPPRYQNDHIFTLKTNFEGTLNILELAKIQKERVGYAPKVLFSSTSEVYGDPEISPQDENYRGNVNTHGIRSCYDEGKRVAESLCMNYWRQYEIPVKIIRIFNTYGPFMDPNDGRVVSNFIMQALRGEKLSIYGDGQQSRSFQYIDDLINGMIKFMDLDEDFPGPINLGNPNEISILELAKNVSNYVGVDLEQKFSSLPKDDPLQRCPNISLAKSKLNWEPKVNLEEGLKKTIKYFASLNRNVYSSTSSK